MGTPFKTTIIDGREEWINKASGKKYVLDPCDFFEGHKFSENDCIAIMTHSHELDLKILSMALRKKLAYIGLIGSENKWLRFKNELKRLGHAEQEIARVRSPIGLNIGGKTPQEVAISIAAELLKRYYEK